MTNMQFFEELMKSLQDRLSPHSIDTKHAKNIFRAIQVPPAALRVRSGGDLVGGLPPDCRSNFALYLLPVLGRQRFYDFSLL